MSRDPTLRLQDILDSISWIESHIDGYTYEMFCADRKTIDAVTRCLEILGEAVKHLPDSLTENFPDVPWRSICGFRDVLAHGYFRAEESIIWDAATVGVLQIKPAVQKMLKKLDS